MTDPFEQARDDYLAIPRDIVGGTGPSAETLLALNDAAGTTVDVQDPPEPVLDPAGYLIGFGPVPPPQRAVLGRAVVLLSTVLATGLTPAQLPNLTIIDPKETP